MMESKKCAEAWKTVVAVYKSTRDTDPETTMQEIVRRLGIKNTKEVFATVAAIKKNDGRIYGENRKYMDSIPVNSESVVWEYGNPMLRVDLDEIHTSHINQLITALRMMESR